MNLDAVPTGRSSHTPLGRVTGAVGVVRVAAGAVGLCAASIMLRAPGLPRWAAWWGLLAGAGEVLARAWSRHGFAYAPFALYWAWVLAMSVPLLAGRLIPRTKELLP